MEIDSDANSKNLSSCSRSEGHIFEIAPTLAYVWNWFVFHFQLKFFSAL